MSEPHTSELNLCMVMRTSFRMLLRLSHQAARLLSKSKFLNKCPKKGRDRNTCTHNGENMHVFWVDFAHHLFSPGGARGVGTVRKGDERSQPKTVEDQRLRDR